MHVLCISPSFVPLADAEAFCGGKMIAGLRAAGIGVEVLRMDKLYRGHPIDDSKLWRIGCYSEVVGTERRRAALASMAAAIRYLTPSWARWVGEVVKRGAELHSDRRFDIVYSRSLPMIAHVAGYWCSRELRLPWIASVNDPWDYHLFPGAKQRSSCSASVLASSFWLRRTLRGAALVVYPNRRLAGFTEKLGGAKHSQLILPHIGLGHDGHSKRHVFSIVHAGRLGANEVSGRSPTALLKGLSEFLSVCPGAARDCRLVLVGPADERTRECIKAFCLQDVVDVVGRVNYEESLEYIASASVCVLVENCSHEGIYLPSKLADYVAARKPILALSPAVGVVADLEPLGGITRVDGEDPSAVQDALVRLYDAFCAGRLAEYAPPQALVEKFTSRAVVERFVQAVTALLPKGQMN